MPTNSPKPLRVEVARYALIRMTKNLGFNAPRSPALEKTKKEIDDEFLSRLKPLIQSLSFLDETDERQWPLFKRGEIPKRKQKHSSYLVRLVDSRLPRRVREEVLGVAVVQEVVMLWAAALAVRGFRGVSRPEFLSALRKEVEWCLKTLGYTLSESRSMRCPFFGTWYEHPHWESLSRADGLREEEIQGTLKFLRRRNYDGCPGYSAPNVQMDLKLETAS